MHLLTYKKTSRFNEIICWEYLLGGGKEFEYVRKRSRSILFVRSFKRFELIVENLTGVHFSAISSPLSVEI